MMLAPYSLYRIDIVGLDALDAAGWPGAGDDSRWSLFAFQTREFLEIWFRTIGAARGSEAQLVVVREADGRALLYLPLCIETRRGVRILRFPDGGVSDYNAPILRPELHLEAQGFRAIWQEVLASLPAVDLVYLPNMPDRVVKTANPFLALGLGAPQGCGSFITLSGSWADYSNEPGRHAALGHSTKKLRKLERDHTVRVEQAPIPDQRWQSWIDCIIDHKRRQYLRTLGTDITALPGYAAFFRAMAEPAQLGRISTLDCLMVDDEIAAGHLGYATARRVYHVLTATNYDRFGKSSAGTSLFSSLLQEAFAEGRSVFDLGIGAEPYKDLWVTDRYDLYSYVKPLSFKGRLAAGALALKRAAASC